jgi:hypothetical protein
MSWSTETSSPLILKARFSNLETAIRYTGCLIVKRATNQINQSYNKAKRILPAGSAKSGQCYYWRQEDLLHWALKGFPEETVAKENEKINHDREQLEQRSQEIETRIEQAKQNEVDTERIEQYCDLVVQKLRDFSFENKRLAIAALLWRGEY